MGKNRKIRTMKFNLAGHLHPTHPSAGDHKLQYCPACLKSFKNDDTYKKHYKEEHGT